MDGANQGVRPDKAGVQVIAAALEDDYDDAWSEDALATIIGLSLAQETFSSDDLRKAMRTPPRSSQYGAAFRNAQAAGLIESVGYATSTTKTRNHGRHLLWRRKQEGVGK